MLAAGGSAAEAERCSVRSDDLTLISCLQSGDHAALGLLFDRYTPLVLSIGSRILRDPGEAQELVPDVFMQIYRKCHLFDKNKGTFRSWLIQIASRKAFDRREYLNLRRVYDDRNLDDFVEVIQSDCDVEYQAQVNESEAALRKAFEQLSEKQRATLELYFFEGYTLREIGQQLNEPLPNVRHHYYRGLEKLKGSIQRVSRKGD